MPREQMSIDIPKEWNENMKHGRCWCGKTKDKFEKGQKFYCSKAHADEYSKRIKYWSIFKNEVLEERGEICVSCGMDKEKFEKAEENIKKKLLLASAKENPKALNAARSVMLAELQKRFEDIMKDDYVMDNMDYQIREEFFISRTSDLYDRRWFRVEVDHILAVALGGEMWDKKNLQVLCSDCHKTKTKDDMRKIKYHRKAKGTEKL